MKDVIKISLCTTKQDGLLQRWNSNYFCLRKIK